MYIVRPVKKDDLEKLYELSAHAKVGLTTLPHDKEILKGRITDSVLSFTKEAKKPGAELYFFVLEDTAASELIGTCSIVAKVGGFKPFYTYALKTSVKESKLLGVKKENQYLQLVKNYDGPTEIGTLFLRSDYRRKGAGRLLSLSRFLFMAQYAFCFEELVLAELRGVFDKQDKSAFWEACGHHFFDVEFSRADLMVMKDKSFIADLMPEHPIYVKLLPKEAQEVIGKVDENTKPALRLLLQEGFQYTGEVDIFEAGPVVGAKLKNIRTVRQSRTAQIAEIVEIKNEEATHFMANIKEFKTFCVTQGAVKRLGPDMIRISKEAARLLSVKLKSRIRYVEI